GEGSDELLAGYGRYARTLWNWRAAGLYEGIVPAPLRAAVAAGLVPRLPSRLARYARRSFLAVPRTPAAMVLDNFAGMPVHLQQELLDPGVLAAGDPYRASLAYFDTPGRQNLLGRMLYTDVKTYLVELLM